MRFATTLEREGWTYRVFCGGEVVAELRAELHGPQALVHNKVLRWGRWLFAAFLVHWAEVLGDLKAAGVVELVASSDVYDEKLLRYWKLMGFECFGSVEADGKTVHFAVMGLG